jgi:outer membrane protein OmpA-like peptidoglycan-associated protein
MAEDARIITVKKIEEELLASERQAGMDREARAESARAAAQSEAERIAIEAQRAQMAARTEAERLEREHSAQAAAAQNESQRIQREDSARLTAAQAETERLKRESAAAQSEAERLKTFNNNQATIAQNESAARLAAAQAETDRLKRENADQAAAAQGEADRLKRENDAERAASLERAAKEKAQADAEKAQLRGQLLLQFNAVLQTRDSARGLIVNMSDVLFDTGKFTLRSAAREKLAKVAGILAGHPGLRMQVEGHTDSVGGDEYNQQLSEHRASAVRDYLMQSGIATASVTAAGFGKSQPAVSNDTAAGRQQNRRVEMVVSGELIGSESHPVAMIEKK